MSRTAHGRAVAAWVLVPVIGAPGLTARASTQSAPTAQVEIAHDGIGCAVVDRFVRIEASLTPAASVARARILFRGATEHWYFTPLLADKTRAGRFVGHIPKPLEGLESFEYYVTATDVAFGEARTPDRRVTVVPRNGTCARGALAASAASLAARLVVSALTGGPPLPAGFASSGLIAGASAGAATAASAGGSAGAAGAGAAGSGGLSATTVAVVGAAVGGGALAATQLTGGGADYLGPISGTYTLDFGGCQRTTRFAGMLAITLKGDGGESSSDGGRYEVLTGTCPNGPQAGNVLNAGFPVGRITRSGDAISYSASEVSGINRFEASFTGTLSGDAITGTFTYTERIAGAAGGYSTTVTLTKR